MGTPITNILGVEAVCSRPASSNMPFAGISSSSNSPAIPKSVTFSRAAGANTAARALENPATLMGRGSCAVSAQSQSRHVSCRLLPCFRSNFSVNTPFITQSSRREFMPHFGTLTASCHSVSRVVVQCYITQSSFRLFALPHSGC